MGFPAQGDLRLVVILQQGMLFCVWEGVYFKKIVLIAFGGSEREDEEEE